jgi:hypothetical protein
MKSPEGFTGEAVTVTGRTKELRIGDYQLSDFHRGWTRGSGWQVMSVASDKKQQKYEFRVARAGAAPAAVQCVFASRELAAEKSGWSLVFDEGASLTCGISAAQDSALLEVSAERDDALSGTLKAGTEYRVQGVGSAMFSGGKKGPVAGFHIYDGDRPVAVVQTMGDKRVVLAGGVSETQRAALMPAIAALLLVDESLRDL